MFGARPQSSSKWLGKRLMSHCIRLEPDDGLITVHIQQLLDSLIPDVPAEQRTDNKGGAGSDKDDQGTHEQIKLMVVDRDTLRS